jgi:hypothetical protein
MREKAKFFHVKARHSASTLAWLLSQWRYAILAIGIAIIFFEFTYWLFNSSVLGTILLSPNVSFIEKMLVLGSPFESVIASNGSYTLILMILLSIIQGVSIAALAYILKHQKKTDPNLVGSSSLIGLLAILGLGCPSCGTSLLTPIVALFVSGSAVAVSEQIMVIVLPAALLVGVYGLYSVGLKTATVRAHGNKNNHATIAVVNVNNLQ